MGRRSQVAAQRGTRTAYRTVSSATLLAELADVLPCGKFARKLQAAGLNTAQLAHRYALLAQHVIPANIHACIKDDPDDDAVLACALYLQSGGSAPGALC